MRIDLLMWWLLVTACTDPPATGYRRITGDGFDGVIDLTHSAWIPTRDDIEALEAVLAPMVPAASKREYTGRLDQGRREIGVWISCRVSPGWETTGLPSVKGGGDCYFSGRYDVTTRRMLSLRPNSGK